MKYCFLRRKERKPHKMKIQASSPSHRAATLEVLLPFAERFTQGTGKCHLLGIYVCPFLPRMSKAAFSSSFRFGRNVNRGCRGDSEVEIVLGDIFSFFFLFVVFFFLSFCTAVFLLQLRSNSSRQTRSKNCFQVWTHFCPFHFHQNSRRPKNLEVWRLFPAHTESRQNKWWFHCHQSSHKMPWDLSNK